MSRQSPKRIVMLASSSPRRRELLALAGAMITLAAAPVDETQRAGETPEAYVRRLSEEKAKAAARKLRFGSLVLAADTVVVNDGRVFGKPADAAEATRLLTALRGKSHEVLSAITVIDTASGSMTTDFARTEVPMRHYTDEELAAYVASGDPFDKAGAYAIQHAGFHPVEGLSGCYANVMGLPLCHVTRTLREMNVPLPADLPQACQQFTRYRCPVYERILEGKP
ncbi:MAG: septum formation protein Maf [Chloroflexi bacterium]|nr:septum formation protein Maf [Chloroflexota bacterium]